MEKTEKDIRWQVNFSIFVGIVVGAIVGAGSMLAFWNGKCAGIDKASRGPVYEIPLGASASQFATAYNSKVWMMIEAPTRPERTSNPPARR